MAAFHVFVEGPTDASPAGLSRLADAIAGHYGLPAADLLARLQKGRFRVKGNTDRATAENYLRDLQRLGARCTIEEANAENSRATPVAGVSTVKPPSPTTPPPSALAGMPPSRPSTPSMNMPFQSGLSAAFSGDAPSADLGALGKTGSQFALSTVDGADDQAGAGGSFGPPAGGGLPASIGPAPDKPKADAKDAQAKKAKPKDEPLDMFAPPEMQGEEFRVDIASDEVDPRRRASTPPPMDGGDAATPVSGKLPVTPPSQKLPVIPPSQKLPVTPPTTGRISSPSIQPPSVGSTSVVAPSRFGAIGEPRTRFAAGVILAVLLGFVPAHFIAKMREESAYAEIDKRVIVAQQAADTADTYATLDRLRADQLGRKESEHRNAAILGFAIWALVGAGIAFVWFKKIPWE